MKNIIALNKKMNCWFQRILYYAFFNLIIIFNFLQINVVYSSVILTCCPNNLELSKTINGVQTYRMDKFFCSNRSVISFDDDSPLLNNSGINGINIIESNGVNIPDCQTYDLFRITDEKSIIIVSKDSCITHYLNGTYIISCNSTLGEDEIPDQRSSLNNYITTNVIKKCCPFGKIYDKKNLKCIKSEKNFDNNFNQFFQQPTVLIDSELKCPDDQVIVDYYYKYFKFNFNDNILIINEINNIKYNLNSLCIESVFDYDNIGEMQRISENFFDHQPKFSFMIRTCNKAEICNRIPCIRRCCRRNEKRVKFNRTTICIPDSSKADIELTFHGFETLDGKFKANVIEPIVYGTLFGQECPMYKLDPNNPFDQHLINYQDGSLYLPYEDQQNSYSNSDYCIEKLESSTGQHYQLGTFLCFPSTETNAIKFKVYSVGILISCVFFVITLLVYLVVPKLRNLPGKILICLVTCLLVAYLGIAIGQMSPPSDDKLCYSFAFFIYFSMMAAFCWMNIMCFDIWLTFGSTSRPRSHFDKHELGRFLLYSLYGWGMPTLITLITISVTRLNLVTEELQPKFGEGRCWFQYAHSMPHLVFFLGPVGILFFINLVLFVLTLKYCNRVKRDIQRMQSTNDKTIMKSRFSLDKTRFIMNTKLFIVMGITWILEIISTIFYNQKNAFWWYASDLSNILQGVLVFFVFVFKRRVWYAVLDRFGIKTEHGRKSTTMGTTSTFTDGSSANLHRLRSLESCSSLIAANATGVTGRRLSPAMINVKMET